MSIIYKGLNPKHHYGLCILTINGELITANGKHFQAIQIPTPHGDIKDINTFLKNKCLTEYIENDVFNKKYSYTIGTGAIYNAPTILEAERE